MSHLDHIVRVKQSLTNLGITCPIKQKELVEKAYVDALVKCHFNINPTFFIPEKERDITRQQLDRWNCVLPIDFSTIWSSFISFINITLSELTTKGWVDSKRVIYQEEGKEVIIISDIPEYKDLVNYLGQELRGCHE